LDIDVSTILMPLIQPLETFYTNLAKSELSKVASEYSDNSAEAAATQQAVDGVKAVIRAEGSSFALTFEFAETMWMDVINSGQGQPSLGGSGGTVTGPNGETYPSKVPKQFWGTPLPFDGAEPASNVMENVYTMANTLFPGDIRNIVTNAKDEIMDVIKPIIRDKIMSTLGV